MLIGHATIGLYQPKTHYNIGGVLRAAHAFGVASVFIYGTRFRKSPCDVYKSYLTFPVFTTTDDILAVCPYGSQPVAVEITSGSTSLPQFKHPKNAYYIFGPEDGSIPTQILKRVPHVVSIPTKICLNLSAAVNVVLYDRVAKEQSSDNP